MPTTPNWSAARNGLPGNLDATNHAAQLTQELGTHVAYPVYEGAQVLTPGGTGAAFTWASLGNTTDLDQPFVLSGTSIGRITLPVLPVGAGADLLVTLYPDSAGAPNLAAPIAATMVPKEWIAALAAPDGIADGGPLADADYNTLYMTGGITRTTWITGPTAGTGNSTAFSVASSGNFILIVGGQDPVTFAPLPSVSTVQYAGGGAVNLPAPQSVLPVGLVLHAVTTTSDLIMVLGGQTTLSAGSAAGITFAASWDPNTGTVGSWSQQTTLPVPLLLTAAVTWNDSVIFAIGGINGGSNTTVATVYTATVTNGQLGAWTATSPYPTAISNVQAAVVGSWLIAAGGIPSTGSSTTTAAAYYARINPDGSLGPWNAGPSLPQGISEFQSGWNSVTTDHAFIIATGVNNTGPGFTSDNVFVLSVDDVAGPADQWCSTKWSHTTAEPLGAFAQGDGSYELIGLNPSNSYYESTTLTPVPEISVPLHATGLTGGATYHVVIQQHQASSTSDYLSYGVTTGALPSDVLAGARHSGTWATYQSGYSVPMAVYDTTASGVMLHTWEDPTATGSAYSSNTACRISTFVRSATSTMTGYAESTNQPNDALNANPTFTSGVGSWTTSGCTLTQSATHVQGGFPFSGLITPAGGTTAGVESNLAPVGSSNPALGPVRWLTGNGWVYSPTGFSSVTVAVNWYTSARTFISTSAAAVSVSANTWTNLNEVYLAPAAAAYASVLIAELGTPTSGNTLYLSNITLTYSPETVTPMSSVVAVDTDPVTGMPTGVTRI